MFEVEKTEKVGFVSWVKKREGGKKKIVKKTLK